MKKLIMKNLIKFKYRNINIYLKINKYKNINISIF